MTSKNDKKKQEKLPTFLYDILKIKKEMLIFNDPVQTTIEKKGKPKIEFNQIPIRVMLPAGFVTENDETIKEPTKTWLNVDPGNVFTFGVSEFIDDKDGGKSYTMSFSLLSYKGETERQKKVVEKLKEIVEVCKTHLIDNRDKVGESDLELADLRKSFSPIKYPKDKNTKVVNKDGKPSLTAKLMWYPASEKEEEDDTGKKVKVKKHSSLFTNFNYVPVKKPVHEEGPHEFEDVDPLPIKYIPEKFDEDEKKDKKKKDIEEEKVSELTFSDLLGSWGYARPFIRFENIFIGALAKCIQIKLIECDIDLLERSTNKKSIFRKKKSDNTVTKKSAIDALMGEDDDEDELEIGVGGINIKNKKENDITIED